MRIKVPYPVETKELKLFPGDVVNAEVIDSQDGSVTIIIKAKSGKNGCVRFDTRNEARTSGWEI